MLDHYQQYHVTRISDYKTNHLLSAEVSLYRPKYALLRMVIFLLIEAGMVVTTTIISWFADCCSSHVNNGFAEVWRHLIFWCVFFVSLFLSKFCVLAVLLYQRYAKASTRLRCRCVPSCSQYSIIAFKKYGVSYGLYKTIFHLNMCLHAPYYEFP